MSGHKRRRRDEYGDRIVSKGGDSRDRRTYGSSSPGSTEEDGVSDGRDDERRYDFRRGDSLNRGRYRAVSVLGTGTFGTVILARDTVSQEDVAIKVVRAISKYSHEAVVEAEILSRVGTRAGQLQQSPPIVRLIERFEHAGHTCLAFERLGPTLLELLERARRPHSRTASSYVCLRGIQTIARGMFRGLAFLHAMELAHTDLKPENVLLATDPPAEQPLEPQSLHVKLIDFGGATFSHEQHSGIVCTRQYRPPEVTLGIRWGTPVDMWSAGCILAELYTGRVLFATHDEAEHLAMMERTLGTLPERMARSASDRAYLWWFKHGYLNWPQIAPSRSSVRHVLETPRLRDALARDRPWTSRHNDFCALIARLLEFEPSARLTAREALEHPFMQQELPAGLT